MILDCYQCSSCYFEDKVASSRIDSSTISPPQPKMVFRNVLVVFICIEIYDSKEELEEVVEEFAALSELIGKRPIVLCPNVHLSMDRAPEKQAAWLINELEKRLTTKGYDVHCLSFGQSTIGLLPMSSEKQLLRTVYLYYMRKRLREVYRRINRNLHLSQQSLMNLVAPELDVLEMLSQSELAQALHRTLSKLKARERRAIELWMEGASNRAIANELKTTVGAVKMLEFRTMLKLKKMLHATADEV